MTPQELRRILRSHQVLSLTGYSQMHLYRLEEKGQFPRRFKLGSQAKTGAVGWWADEVDAWLKARVQLPAPQPDAAA